MENIKELRGIEYHDANLLKLVFNFENNSIEIVLDQVISETKISLLFEGISVRKLQGLEYDEDIEINSTDFFYVNNKNIAQFVFLQGFGKPSCELVFSFNQVKLIQT